MSFTLSYIEFFKVRILESGSNLPIEGIRFVPSQECIMQMDNHRLFMKSRNNGFDLYYQRNPQALEPILAPISQRTRFSFGFIITDTNFFTKYEPDFDNSEQLYFDNLDGAGNILPGAVELLSENAEVQGEDAVKIYAKTFSIDTDLTLAPVPAAYSINEKHNPGNTLQTVVIDNPLGLDNVTTKLNDPLAQVLSFIGESGPYLLESDSGQPATSTIYLDDQLVRENITGITDIYWENSQGNAAPGGNNYEIRFKLR